MNEVEQNINTATAALSKACPDIPINERPAHRIQIVDWSLDTLETKAAEAKLEEAIDRYTEEITSDIGEVRGAYKEYANAHTRYFYGAVPQPNPSDNQSALEKLEKKFYRQRVASRIRR